MLQIISKSKVSRVQKGSTFIEFVFIDALHIHMNKLMNVPDQTLDQPHSLLALSLIIGLHGSKTCQLAYKTQFQIEGGGVVQGVTKLLSTFSVFLT